MIEVQIDWSNVKQSTAILRAMPNNFIANVLARTAVKLIDDAPAETGQLARSGRHRMISDGQGEIIFDSGYASFVHDGRGSGGVDFNAIADWAKSKGKTERDAFAIAVSIMHKGTKKQPWVNAFLKSHEMSAIVSNVIKRELSHVA